MEVDLHRLLGQAAARPNRHRTGVRLVILAIAIGLFALTVWTIVQRRELRRTTQRMRLLAAAAEHAKELVLIIRANGDFEDANDAFLGATGYSRGELASADVGTLLAPGSRHMRPEIQTAVRSSGVWRGTLVRLRKDGSTFPAACTVSCLRNEAGAITHFVGVERDASDEAHMREEMIHSERLAAMTEVVAGVAHEINNPLQAILGCTELLLDSTAGAVRADLENVRSEAVRAGQIVRNLLAFVHRGSGERRSVDLNEIVRSTAALRAYHLQQNGVLLDLRLHPSPLPVSVNQEEIRQALLNLLLNAEHAVRSSTHAGCIAVSTWSDRHGIAVEVSDDGPGIPPELRGRIFEPFFTTKQVGEATGLGLSTSLGIALAHGGALEFRPAPDGGAAFRLTLPAGAETSGPAAAPGGAGQRTAIIVADDPAIQSLLRRLLERRGYGVVPAEDGDAALAEVERALPDLVICDARMPRMNGPEFYRRGCQSRPDLRHRFVLMTGDAVSADVAAFAEASGVPLLQKPFTAAELDAALGAAGAADGFGQESPLGGSATGVHEEVPAERPARR